jgi:predicted RNA-binding Zn ribbon-like protein
MVTYYLEEALQILDPAAQPDRLTQLAVDLVNLPADRLDAAGLAAYLIDHGEAAPIDLTARDVDQLIAVRGELSDLFDAAAAEVPEGGAAPEPRARGDAARAGSRGATAARASADAVAERVNRLLDRAQTPPRLSNHDGTAWHLHITADEAPWADWLAAVAGLALARLLAEDGVARIGRCAAPSCSRVFAGGLRNHPRRYCSPTCANRARVAAFRARRRASS